MTRIKIFPRQYLVCGWISNKSFWFQGIEQGAIKKWNYLKIKIQLWGRNQPKSTESKLLWTVIKVTILSDFELLKIDIFVLYSISIKAKNRISYCLKNNCARIQIGELCILHHLAFISYFPWGGTKERSRPWFDFYTLLYMHFLCKKKIKKYLCRKSPASFE